MRLKKTTLLLFLLVGLFSLTVNVKALENSLDEAILNENLMDISFISGNAVMMGNLTNNLTVDNILSDKVVLDEDFFDKYDINGIYIKNNEEKLQKEAIVTSGMLLVFETNSGESYEYTIQVVGDLNDDGIVNDNDTNAMIDNIINNSEVTIVNDINSDESTDIVDATGMVYSIKNGNWVKGNMDDIQLSSEINSKDTVYVGDTLEVNYKIKGYTSSTIKGIFGVLNYDKNMLQLDNIFSNNNYGYMNNDGKFLYIYNNEDEEITITIVFNILSKGSTNISINSVESSIDGVGLEDTLDQTKNINILEYGKGGDDDSSNTNKNTSNNVNNNISNPVSNTVSNSPVLLNNDNYYFSNVVATTISLSSNNYIKFLKIKNYKINFDKEKLEYNITVGNKVDSLDLDIILDDNNASYEVFGNKDFKVGKNKVSIEVTAEDGSTRTYIINVDKKKEITKVKDNNSSRIVIIILIILIIIGLIYVIFKDDEEENKG